MIELMVVMVIMAMIAAAAGFGVMRAMASARIHETTTRARTIQDAATNFLLEGNEGCPDVEALIRMDFLQETKDSNDAWGNPFAVECTERAVHVKSCGPDGEAGTVDDLGF